MRPPLKKAKALQRGSVVAICSPAGPSPAGRIEEGANWLESQGFCPVVLPHATNNSGYLAGSDEERASDLMQALCDEGIDAVLCARGGFGSARLLPLLDWEALARRQTPPLLMGFSDITVLLSAFYERLGWVGLYSPMLTSNLIVANQDWTQQQWKTLVQLQPSQFPVPLEGGLPYEPLACKEPILVIEAPLYVANLTLLASLCGTPYQPKTQGHLLVLEDWKESDYSLDRLLTQLQQAGLLSDLAGLLFADFSYIERQCDLPLPKLLAHLVASCDIPAMGMGWQVGHGAQTSLLPVGTQARWCPRKGNLTLLESFVQTR